MDRSELITEIKNLRAATVEALDKLPSPDEREFTLRSKWGAVDEAIALRGRRDAFDEVLILLGVPVGGVDQEGDPWNDDLTTKTNASCA